MGEIAPRSYPRTRSGVLPLPPVCRFHPFESKRPHSAVPVEPPHTPVLFLPATPAHSAEEWCIRPPELRDISEGLRKSQTFPRADFSTRQQTHLTIPHFVLVSLDADAHKQADLRHSPEATAKVQWFASRRGPDPAFRSVSLPGRPESVAGIG